jgi:hypothetical protein
VVRRAVRDILEAAMKAGDKVRVHYKDAIGKTLLWSGTLKEPVGDGWRVDVGGVAIVFQLADIEVVNEQEASGAVAH